MIVNKSLDQTSHAYIPYIDGLRGIAVLAVVIYHLNSTWLPGGFAGVDMFFTISGFVVSFSIAKKSGLNPINFLSLFYARRIQRIIPALSVCLVLVSLAVVLFIPQSWLSDEIQTTGKYAFFGLSNLILMQSKNDYFGAAAIFNPFTHTWSLGVEEQFYLIFPFLFYLWTSVTNRSNLKYASIAAFATFFLCSVGYSILLSHSGSISTFYSIFSRFWELASGVILYQITENSYNSQEIDTRSRWSIGVSISLILVMLGLLFARPENFPFPLAIFPVFGTTGLIFFLRGNKHNLLRRWLSNRVLLFIGKVSYSLYLWHWPIFLIFRWTVGLESIACYVSAILLTSLITISSYYLIENLVRYSPMVRTLPSSRIVLIGFLFTIIAFYTSGQIFGHWSQLSLSVTSRAPWHLPAIDVVNFNKSHSNCPMTVGLKSIGGADVTVFSRPNCQKIKSPSRIFVAGDSHTGAYKPMLQQLSMDVVTDVTLYAKQGCPYIGLFAPLNQLAADCQLFYKVTTADMIENARRGDIVFLPSLRLQRFGFHWMLFSEINVIESMSGKAALKQRIEATTEAVSLLKTFTTRGIKVVIEAPKPIFKAPNFRCSDWFNQMNPICDRGLKVRKDELLNYRLPVLESIQTLSQQVDGVSIWDPFPILCPEAFCQANQDRKPLFFDGDHLSDYGNMFLYPSFEIFIRGLI